MKKPRLYLHVGYEKTGSSYMQSVLYASRLSLRQHGLSYPPGDDDEAQANGDIGSGNGHFLVGPKVADTLRGTPDGTIYSSELAFKYFCSTRGLDDLRTLTQHFDLRLLLMLRDVPSHVGSLYQQAVKRHGYALSVDEYSKEYEHPAMAARLVGLGEEGLSITVRSYPAMRQNLRGVLAQWLGIVESALHLPARTTVNRSLSVAELELMLSLNRGFGQAAAPVADLLCNTLPHIPSSPSICSDEVLDELLHRFTDDLDMLDRVCTDGPLSRSGAAKSAAHEDPFLSREQYRVLAEALTANFVPSARRSRTLVHPNMGIRRAIRRFTGKP